MKKWLEKEGGFTLVEVLASIIILSVASLTMTAFFNNAMSYNKGNQNKTVLINIARNALVYMEKQDFKSLKTYFETTSPIIKYDNCEKDNLLECEAKFKSVFVDWTTLSDVLNPQINNITYQVTIKYQAEIVKSNMEDTDVILDKKRLNKYLLPIIVSVRNPNDINNSRHLKSEVEGYITSDIIR